MNKQLVVVVHGVGVKSAGVSTDLLCAALQDEPTQSPATRKARPRFPPHSSDDFQLRELDRYSSNNKSAVFPARLRRYRRYANPEHTVVERERVVVDFFWGDITAIMPGVPGVMLGFFKIAMGLSHAIRENAREIFKGSNWIGKFAGCCARGAALTIHGPIVASNLVLLLGLILFWVVGLFGAAGAVQFWLAVVLTGLVATIGGLLAQRFSDSFLSRFLASWVFAVGLILPAIVFLDALAPTMFDKVAVEPAKANVPQLAPSGWMDARLKEMSCGLAAHDSRACENIYQGIYLLGLRIFAAQVMCWFAVLGMTAAVIAASIWRRATGSGGGAVNLVAPAICLMILLWFVFISAIWAAVGKIGAEIVPGPDLVTSALREAPPAVVCIVLLATVGLVISWKKRVLRRMDPADYMKQPNVYAERHRLIVNRYMLVVLLAFFIAVVWIAIHGLSLSCTNGHGPWPVNEICAATTTTLKKSTGVFLIGLATIALFLVLLARAEFAAGIGVAADVLAYLNDYSWGARAADGAAARKSTWLERILPRGLVGDEPRSGYWLRQRIQDRLKVLMTQLIIDEQPDEIVVVAHSQGTVIALDVIAREGRGWLLASPENAKLELVTMGSPYTHLYHHYFPSSFPPPESVPGLRQRIEDDPRDASLSRWVNIFRIDDFVGTHIGAGHWPTERPVPPNGHTMYWVDRSVIAILQKEL